VWTRDGSRLLLGAQVTTDDPNTPPPGGIVVVDTATWEPIRYVGLDISPEALELDSSGELLAVASADSTDIVLLDVGTLEEIQRVSLNADDRLYALSFSPDDLLLVGAGVFGTLHTFDTRTWQARPPAHVTDGPVLQIEWLPDDRTAVAVGEDGRISLFDVQQARVRAVPLPAAVDSRPARAYVVPDPDSELIALGEQRAVLRYTMDPSLWLREVCRLAGRDLTRAEWARYLPDRPYRPTCSDLR
jgi:WD40 repeat protein